MWFRILFFLAFQLAGAALGWHAMRERGALVGVLLAGVAWLAIDLLRGARVIRWLRTGSTADAPKMRGLWGEACDRMRRLLRQAEQKNKDSEHRLQEFLAGIQASPNGVTLLDRVWGDHVYIDERTVDVHVKRLREALGGGGTMIETVRGAGYRITAQAQPAATLAPSAAAA